MGKHYKIDKSQDFRKFRIEVVVSVLLAVALVIGLTFVLYDLYRNKNTVIDDSGNQAILSSVGSLEEEFTLHEREKYSIKVPADWRRINNPEVLSDHSRYYPDRYQGTTGDHIGRMVDVYIDDIPADLGIDKVVSVSPSSNGVVAGELSQQCYKFTDFPEGKAGNTFPSEWEEQNITFSCKTSKITNIVGAIESEQRTGIRLPTEAGDTNFFIVFTDHGSSLDNSIFFKVLDGFRTK